MTTWGRVAGNVNDTITPVIDGVADLSAVTAVSARVWKNGTPAATLVASVLSVSDRTLTVELDAWLEAQTAAGIWWVEYDLTFPGPKVITWPEAKPDEIHVRAKGA